MTKRMFTKTWLEENDLPGGGPEGGEVVSDKITGKSRWSILHELIFRLPDQLPGEAWRVTYSVGATESQHECPWEYDKEVEATLVRQVEKTMKVWEVA